VLFCNVRIEEINQKIKKRSLKKGNVSFLTEGWSSSNAVGLGWSTNSVIPIVDNVRPRLESCEIPT